MDNGDRIVAGYTYHADHSHCGSISCDKQTLIEKGLLEQFDAPTQDEFLMMNDWNNPRMIAYYYDEYCDEKEQFFNTYSHYISHCFYVTAPDGTTLSYGDETPHGKIGSQEFTLWWNGLPKDTLTYCDIDSWCDG